MKEWAKKLRFITCKTPSDILVVSSREIADQIAGHVPNPCHNHRIIVGEADFKTLSKTAVPVELVEELEKQIRCDYLRGETCPEKPSYKDCPSCAALSRYREWKEGK